MKFELTASHYLPGDRLAAEGEVLTEADVDFTKFPPNDCMKPLDEEAIALYSKVLAEREKRGLPKLGEI